MLVPIDKAANNVGLTCKKNLFGNTSEGNFDRDIWRVWKHCWRSHWCDQKSKFKYRDSRREMFNDLPLIHAPIKMHKDPIKFRFIIGSRTGVIKPAAKKLVQILKLVMKTHRRYCDKINFYTGIERNTIVENKKIPQNIEKINNRKAARNIKVCDFSTLYTKIPPTDPKEKLKEVVTKAFKGGTNQSIRVNKKDAHWDNSKDGQTFSKVQIFLLIDTVIDNSFFRFDNKVFRQKIGIHMGVDPAPQMANLYLYYYEAAFMGKLTKQDYSKAKKFNNTCRFIDDLGTLNNDGILVTENAKICPVELMLNVGNQYDNHATFLDIEVNVEGDQFKTKRCDKREYYKFEIVNYPDLSGNIPHGAAHGAYTSQIIRCTRVCNEADDFKERVKVLVNKLIKKDSPSIARKILLRNALGSIIGLQRNMKDWQCKISTDAGSTNRVHNWHWYSTHTFYRAALNNSYWHRPRNELRLSADDGGGYCDYILDNNGGGQS